MLSGLVAVVIFAEPEDLLCGDFAAVIGQCEHLVSGGLDGAALVDGDMPGIRADDALMRPERGGDERQICLSTAGDKVNVSIGGCAEFFQPAGCFFAVFVLAVSAGLFHVGLVEKFQNGRVRSFRVVAVKKYHF